MFCLIKFLFLIIILILLELSMTGIDLSNLIKFQFDFSLVQEGLSTTIKDIYSKLTGLQCSTAALKNQSQAFMNETSKIYLIIDQSNEKNTHIMKSLQSKLQNIWNQKKKNIENEEEGNKSKKETKQIQIDEKTPQQVLDHIENRLQLNLAQKGDKQIELNCSQPNSDRVVQKFRVKESPRGMVTSDKDIIDQKVYSIYEKTVQKIQSQITQLRKDLHIQLNLMGKNYPNIANTVEASVSKQLEGKKNEKATHQQQGQKDHRQNMKKQKSKIAENKKVSNQVNQNILVSNMHIESNKEIANGKTQIKNNNSAIASKHDTNFDLDRSSLSLNENMLQAIESIKREIKSQILEVIKNNEIKFEELSRTDSLLADHYLQIKRLIQEFTNEKDAIKLQVSSIRQKTSSSIQQTSILLDQLNQSKNRLKSVESSVTRLSEEIKQCKQSSSNGQVIKQEANEDENGGGSNSSKKDIFRESHSSFRSSMAGNLHPIRNNSILKANSNKLQSLQENFKLLNSKTSNLIDRLNKMQDERKKIQLNQFSSSLPKIQKENKSNVNPIQVIKKQIKKLNEDLVKTNEKLTSTKDKLNELYQTHREIPDKIQDIYCKLREYNELQEDRLIQLIKQLINRALTDPFDNHFTNRLKRQINVKFLEIKHQYNCILKEIQSKVENRAEISELQKVVQKFQESVLEVKSIVSKKCDNEDFKKGMKYIQGKVKDVFNFAKSQTVALANEQKQYIGAKKHQLH